MKTQQVVISKCKAGDLILVTTNTGSEYIIEVADPALNAVKLTGCRYDNLPCMPLGAKVIVGSHLTFAEPGIDGRFSIGWIDTISLES